MACGTAILWPFLLAVVIGANAYNPEIDGYNPPICKKGEYKLAPHNSCKKFYECKNGKVKVRICSMLQKFDRKALKCKYTWDVICKNIYVQPHETTTKPSTGESFTTPTPDITTEMGLATTSSPTTRSTVDRASLRRAGTNQVTELTTTTATPEGETPADHEAGKTTPAPEGQTTPAYGEFGSTTPASGAVGSTTPAPEGQTTPAYGELSSTTPASGEVGTTTPAPEGQTTEAFGEFSSTTPASGEAGTTTPVPEGQTTPAYGEWSSTTPASGEAGTTTSMPEGQTTPAPGEYSSSTPASGEAGTTTPAPEGQTTPAPGEYSSTTPASGEAGPSTPAPEGQTTPAYGASSSTPATGSTTSSPASAPELSTTESSLWQTTTPSTVSSSTPDFLSGVDSLYASGSSTPAPTSSNATAASPQCPATGWHRYPHSDCWRFYECLDGVLAEVSCYPLQSFDKSTGRCDWSWKVNCHAKSTLPSLANTEPPVPSFGYRPPTCPASGAKKSPHNDCWKYYDCQDGDLAVELCPPLQRFNRKTLTCEFTWKVNCDALPAVSVEQPGAGGRSPVPPIPVCPAGAAQVAAETDCAKFWTCSGGHASLHSCGSLQRFSRTTKKCEWLWTGVDCDKRRNELYFF